MLVFYFHGFTPVATCCRSHGAVVRIMAPLGQAPVGAAPTTCIFSFIRTTRYEISIRSPQFLKAVMRSRTTYLMFGETRLLVRAEKSKRLLFQLVGMLSKTIRGYQYYNPSFSCFLWSIIFEHIYNYFVLNTLQNHLTHINFS